MNKDRLGKILNSNQELQQDIKQSKFLQNNLEGILRNIETIIPEDCRENFYTNLKTLRVNFDDNERLIENKVFGAYSLQKNEILINENTLNLANRNNDKFKLYVEQLLLEALYHELLHMASNTKSEHLSGFQDIFKDENGKFLYTDILEGMSEGFTEYLALLSFDKENKQSISTYGIQINIMNHLSWIVGLETVKKAYFNNRNGMQEIENVLQKFDNKKTHNDLYNDIENNFNIKKDNELFDTERLADIDKKLLILDKQKIQYMQKQNPNLSEEFIKYYWDKVGKLLNTKENLEQIDEESGPYVGLDEVQMMFENFSKDTYKSKEEDENKGKIKDTETKEKLVFVVNAQASLEEKYEKGNDVTVIEPILGTSIEDFAKAIMENKENAKTIVGKFNNFEINSNDYESVEKLVEAYERHVEEYRNRKFTSKQEKITPAEIESVIEERSNGDLQIMTETVATKQLIKNEEKEKDVKLEK